MVKQNDPALKTNALSKLYSRLISSRGLIIVFIPVAIIYLFSLWHNGIYADDSWFGEQAYWLAKTGIVKAETMKGLLGMDSRLFVYHKLNIILGAALVKLFGWSVYIFKFLTLSVYLLFFKAYYYYHRFTDDDLWKNKFYLGSFLIFVNPITL